MEQRIQDVWGSIEKQTVEIQKDYQNELETIIDEVAELKYEKLAEIKVMYKKFDPSDAEKMQEKQDEIDTIKSEMEVLKLTRIDEAKKKMEFQKKSINNEKENFFKTMKGSMKLDQQQSDPFSKSPNLSIGGLSPMVEKEDGKARTNNKKSKSLLNTNFSNDEQSNKKPVSTGGSF